MQGKCNICFLTGVNLYNMTTIELKYYQQFVLKVELSSHTKVICVYCKSMLKRINQFAEKCQKSQDFLMDTIKLESDMIMQLKNSHNLSPCTITYLHVGPTEYDSVKKENDSEDDIPLVLLSQNGNLSEFLDDSDDHNAEPKEHFNEEKNKINHIKEKKNKSKKGSHLKEGFSSRMVQETDEYIVIKLTKEQVLAEMQENKMADKYKMAPYKCEKCIKGFNFDDVLQAHMEKHLPKNGQFICDICTQHCPSAVSLRGHLKSHTTRYQCKVCQIVRLSRQHVLEHFALEHTDSAVSYRCTQCPYTSKKRTVMQRHVRLHSSSEPHACHQCGKLYKSRESLRVHIMRHDNSKRHQCDVCSRWFIYATQLKKHMQAVHVRRDYYCVECDIKFKSMYTLKQHFQRAKKHRDASAYKFSCSSCPQRFVSGAALATHDTRAHGAAARAACGRCGRRYSCGEALRLHERRAHAPRPPPAPCPLCHRTFSRKSVLRIHMRTHTGERPHACECGASYAQPAALRAHRAAKHKNEITNGPERS